MLVIRHGHDHCIYIFAIENLFVISCRRNLLLYRFLRRFVSAVIQVANRHTFHTRHLQRRRQ